MDREVLKTTLNAHKTILSMLEFCHENRTTGDGIDGYGYEYLTNNLKKWISNLEEEVNKE